MEGTNSTKANHQAKVIKVGDPVVHPNADTLEIFKIDGYQVISKKGDLVPGDLAVYIQPDSVVPQTEVFRWIWEPWVLVDPANVDDAIPEVPEKRRRITVKKLRGEYSEGLLIKLSHFQQESPGLVLEEGDDAADILGITHYDPDAGNEDQDQTAVPKRKKRYPKTFLGWFHYLVFVLFGYRSRRLEQNYRVAGLHIGVYDVESLKNYPHVFMNTEEVVVTEKIHGSNGRYVNIDGVQYAGSRKLWKAPSSGCKFRQALVDNPEIEDFCKANPGYVLYGEVTPTQKGFDYGCEPNEVRFFAFDVKDPHGHWLEHDEAAKLLQAAGIVDIAPVLYRGPYDKQAIANLVSGPSAVKGAKHIREGIVIKSIPERREPGVGRAQLKIVSNAFLEKDGK
jgi:RNA ligase-like protein/uncharacterized protein